MGDTSAMLRRAVGRGGQLLLTPCRRQSRPPTQLKGKFPRHLCAQIKSDEAESEKKPEQPPQKSAVAPNAMTKLLPGVAMAGTVAGIGVVGADFLGQGLLAAQGISGSSPISGIPVSILLGIGLNNMVALPEVARPGLKYATTTILRAGIVCVGAKLNCTDMVQLGATGIPIVAASIGA